MEIIAKTTHGFIVEIGKEELANLAGYYSHYNSGSLNTEIGAKIDVHSMFSTLWNISSKKGDLKKVSETLHGIANLLELQSPIIEELGQSATGK